MGIVNGKVAIVTGGASGIGQATSFLFAKEGAKVVVSDLNESKGLEVVEKIRKDGGEAIFVKANVSDPAEAEAMVKKTVEHFGHLDIAFNNAGIAGENNLIGDMSVDGWKRVIDVNLSSVFYCMKYEIPAMLAAGKGSIVNTASILGKVGFPSAAGYVAAKHGVLGLTETAVLEYGKQIRINAVGPTFIHTPLIMGIDENLLLPYQPNGRLGEPEEIAEFVVWLSSDKASLANGAYYPMDGGYLAR